MNMKLNDVFPSNYLKASDLGDEPRTLTIRDSDMVEMQDGSRKLCIFFEQGAKGLIVNKTNANTIAAAYGDDTDDWRGQKVQLISVPVDFQGRTVDAIRVRVRPAAKAQPQSNVRSGMQSYGEAKGRAQAQDTASRLEDKGRGPMETGNRPAIDDSLEDLPF
jgi:hypothetical protein